MQLFQPLNYQKRFNNNYRFFQNMLDDHLQQRLLMFKKNFATTAKHGFFETQITTPNSKFNLQQSFESLPLNTNSFDAVFSAGPIGLTNDVPGALIQWLHCLKPGGLFIGCFFGENSLQPLADSLYNLEDKLENRTVPRFLPQIHTKDAGALLQRAGFAMPVADKTSVTVQFETLKKALKSVQGFYCLRQCRPPLSKKLLHNLAFHYPKNLNLQFDIVTITGWKKTQEKKLIKKC